MKDHDRNEEEFMKARLVVNYIPILQELKHLSYLNIAVSLDNFSPGYDILIQEDLDIIQEFIICMNK